MTIFETNIQNLDAIYGSINCNNIIQEKHIIYVAAIYEFSNFLMMLTMKSLITQS